MTDPQSSQAPATGTEGAHGAPRFGLGDQAAMQQQQHKQNKVLWGIFGVLVVLAGGVFFVLPRYVAPAQPPAPIVVTPPVQGSATASPAMSPFEEAQRLRQREAAQNSLATLLELQAQLEDKSVENWAAAAFAAGLEFARQGDEAYRTQEFDTAGALYQQGVAALQAILNNETTLFDTQLAAGEAALAAADATAATEAFTLALAVRPDSEPAQQGLRRAGVLDQVLQLLSTGRELQAAADFDAARASFDDAKALDPANSDIDAALQQLQSAIADNAYATAMSRGYAALQANKPAEAEEAFSEAGSMRPGSAEVETALAQARDAATTARIKIHIDAANAFEAEETWATALREWQSAIAVDPNLVVAQQGLTRSENRRDLDVFFETVIREPLRLVDETIYNQTQQLLRDLESFEPKGPRLADQYARVEALLAQARVPVTVQLTSDGVTEVNLLRVSALGTFSTHTQELLPGHYVAVGLRPGYRDVRVEFTVNLGTAPAPVSVICTDKI
jgi:tetratricopeptide (TPR) repeat protein